MQIKFLGILDTIQKIAYLCTALVKNALIHPIRNRLRQNRGVAQLARVHVWGARGRSFESSHPDIKRH